MATQIDGGMIRRTLLEVVQDYAKKGQLSQDTVLNEASQRLGIRRDPAREEALLTLWFDLFRTGHLSWGLNLNNPNPPWCHLTEQGRRTLESLSRDPANPDGYLAHLTSDGPPNEVALSYISEALITYNSNCYKATAVLVGAAAESLVLEVRDEIVTRYAATGAAAPRDLEDWRIKRVLDALEREFTTRRSSMSRELADNVDAYWPGFTHQIRTARNDVGHPVSIAPVTSERVHASLLILPELARLSRLLKTWAAAAYA